MLKEEPIRTVVQVDKGTQRVNKTTVTKGTPFERWEYYGDVDTEDLIAMGCNCPEDAGVSLSACVVFINDRPVKVQLNTLDTGEIPYDFFQWVEVEDSPWGIGEPRKLAWQQRVITATWRAMMDNAADSSGAMICMSKDVEPEDGIWEITGKKMFQDMSDDGDVRKAFAMFQITNNQGELQNIIELALKFTDLESGVPALAQGEKGSAPETLGGMKILMQGADTTRRRQVKQWDDQITRPHISRYYHWNMQYNPKPEIKGDFEVDARGTSVLLVKDQAVEAVKALMQMKGDPEVSVQVNWSKATKQLLTGLHLDVLNTEDEVKAARDKAAQAPPPPMPQIEVAKIRTASDEKIKTMELQAESAEAEKDRQNSIAIQMITEKMQTMELTSVERLALDKLKTELAGVTMKLDVQTALSKADIAHQKDLAVGAHMLDLHKHVNPHEPVLAPPTEPVGRAARGKSFTQ